MKTKFLLIATLILMSCGKNKNTSNNTDITSKEETLCFELKKTSKLEDGDKFEVTTNIQLITNGEKVTGTCDEERLVNGDNVDGASGNLIGYCKGDTLYLDYTYSIEGYTETKETIYLLQGDKLTEKKGELIEKNGKMIFMNKEKAAFTDKYKKVICN